MKSSSGQLALMDAIVFFVIAVMISSVLFYRAESHDAEAPMSHRMGQSDPAAILPVFLQAAVGEEIMIDLNGPVHVSGRTEIAECLLIELEALSKGEDVEVFRPLNEKLVGILESVCNSVLDPYLICSEFSDSYPRVLLSIPHRAPGSGAAYAASLEFPGRDGQRFLIVLSLVPPALLELVYIRGCDLDLGPSIGLAPADLDPLYHEHKYQ